MTIKEKFGIQYYAMNVVIFSLNPVKADSQSDKTTSYSLRYQSETFNEISGVLVFYLDLKYGQFSQEFRIRCAKRNQSLGD